MNNLFINDALEHGHDIAVAINFPADGVGDARYEHAIFEAIHGQSLQANRLTLEILEGAENTEHGERRDEFLRRLRDSGICLTEDDLGSGHSSLLRLDQFAFNEVKMDQALVRSSVRRPQRALEFMLYLTRLAHAFELRLIVEGLEHSALIEAAAILGTDLGQGYGIAKPMQADALPTWIQGFSYDVDPYAPRSTLGAMATYLLWDIQAGTQFRNDRDATKRQRSVEAYLSHRGLGQSALGQHLAKHFASGAAVRAQMRPAIIEEFTQIWLDESSKRDVG